MYSIINLIFGLIITCIPIYGIYKKVDIIKSFSEGAHKSIQAFYNISPIILIMFTLVNILKNSGFFTILSKIVDTEIISIMIMRMLSNSASNALLTDIIKTHGIDSIKTLTASSIINSTETVLLILSIYFGSINIKNLHYSLWSSIIASLSGMISAIFIAKYFYIQ